MPFPNNQLLIGPFHSCNFGPKELVLFVNSRDLEMSQLMLFVFVKDYNRDSALPVLILKKSKYD